MTATVIHGDCLEALKLMEADSVDSIVTDPPAGIAFMGKSWDSDKGGRQAWVAWMESVAVECLRVLKPGGNALVWALPRTSHWTGWAWENAGWEVREKLVHLFGSGFPKSLDVSKAIDKAGAADGEALLRFRAAITHAREAKGMSRSEVSTAVVGSASGAVWNWETGLRVPTGEHWNQMVRVLDLSADFTGLRDAAEREIIAARRGNTKTFDVGADEVVGPRPPVTAPATDAARQWDGWGTALKPAGEDWWLFRKPLSEGTVAANVLKHGTGGINIDGCRIQSWDGAMTARKPSLVGDTSTPFGVGAEMGGRGSTLGRWPANVILDEEAGALLDEQTAGKMHGAGAAIQRSHTGDYAATSFDMSGERPLTRFGDVGGASRFFYTAKSSRSERTHGGTVENKHPTVKAISLMRYLVILITPPNGTVLDPFTGSGSTGVGAILEGFNFVGCEMEIESVETARERLKTATLVATGGIKNPWEDGPEVAAPASASPAASEPTSLESLFDFDG